ncbi:MAG: hypothetical protein EZS28_034146 [Streblomastix strix]|uniref:Uncharacterized protein n=1 Tax=Streblomastix strix TaxID=222440 RepID=A0A5J4UIN8_9EUKA|nr:MAG: hypothetical protein EZS28_034146 [Streblomastix strix]
MYVLVDKNIEAIGIAKASTNIEEEEEKIKMKDKLQIIFLNFGYRLSDRQRSLLQKMLEQYQMEKPCLPTFRIIHDERAREFTLYLVFIVKYKWVATFLEFQDYLLKQQNDYAATQTMQLLTIDERLLGQRIVIESPRR